MSGMGFLELALSLSVQASVVIAICTWLVRQRAADESGHRLWGTCHILILIQTAAALLIPHLRLIPHSLVTQHIPLQAIVTSEVWLGRIVMSVWGSGAILYALAIVVGALGVRRLLASAQPLTLLYDGSSDFDDVKVVISSQVATPFCWQLHRSIIVLPEAARFFPPDELRAILRHERAHLQSGHPLSLFLQRLVEMLYWFHPLVWWASRQADLHREFHCDHQASPSALEVASYLRSLLRLSEFAPEPVQRLPAGLRFHGSRTTVKLRVERLMRDDRSMGASRGWASAHLGLVGVVAVVSIGLWLPIDVCASSRSVWSPWPRWSAQALYEFGIPVRDYEIDGHRLRLHELEDEWTEHATTPRRFNDE